jgi:hypothetical protein
MGVTAGIFLASILQKEMRYLVYKMSMKWPAEIVCLVVFSKSVCYTILAATLMVPNSIKDNEILLLKYHQHGIASQEYNLKVKNYTYTSKL